MFQVSNVVLTQRHRSKIKSKVIINSSCLLLFQRDLRDQRCLRSSSFRLRLLKEDHVKRWQDHTTPWIHICLGHDNLLTRTTRVPRGAECWDNMMINVKESNEIARMKRMLVFISTRRRRRHGSFSQKEDTPFLGWPAGPKVNGCFDRGCCVTENNTARCTIDSTPPLFISSLCCCCCCQWGNGCRCITLDHAKTWVQG